MKHLVFVLISLFFSLNLYALSADVVSQPADCLTRKITPCTFKSLSRQSVLIADHVELVLLKNAVVKVVDFASLNLEPVVGGFIIKSAKKSVAVRHVQLDRFPSYADITKGQIEVIDGRDYYSYKFVDGEPEKYLLDREPFIKKLSIFYSNVADLKSEYKYISPIYNRSFKKDVALHKQILSRKIASIEEEEKLKAEELKKLREEEKRNKQTFFKRTFDQ